MNCSCCGDYLHKGYSLRLYYKEFYSDSLYDNFINVNTSAFSINDDENFTSLCQMCADKIVKSEYKNAKEPEDLVIRDFIFAYSTLDDIEYEGIDSGFKDCSQPEVFINEYKLTYSNHRMKYVKIKSNSLIEHYRKIAIIHKFQLKHYIKLAEKVRKKINEESINITESRLVDNIEIKKAKDRGYFTKAGLSRILDINPAGLVYLDKEALKYDDNKLELIIKTFKTYGNFKKGLITY